MEIESESDKEKGGEVFLYSVRQSDVSQSFYIGEWEEQKERQRGAGGTDGDRDGVEMR